MKGPLWKELMGWHEMHKKVMSEEGPIQLWVLGILWDGHIFLCAKHTVVPYSCNRITAVAGPHLLEGGN